MALNDIAHLPQDHTDKDIHDTPSASTHSTMAASSPSSNLTTDKASHSSGSEEWVAIARRQPADPTQHDASGQQQGGLVKEQQAVAVGRARRHSAPEARDAAAAGQQGGAGDDTMPPARGYIAEKLYLLYNGGPTGPRPACLPALPDCNLMLCV